MRALAPIAEVAVARQVFLTERLLYRQWCIGRHCWVCVCMGVYVNVGVYVSVCICGGVCVCMGVYTCVRLMVCVRNRACCLLTSPTEEMQHRKKKRVNGERNVWG